MKLYRFEPEVGFPMDAYHSSGLVISRTAHLFQETVVNRAYLKGGGVIGAHQATIPQLFFVVHGEGWVRGGSSERVPIQTGQAAYWEKGEWQNLGQKWE
jgi:hypothetical protein